MKILLLTDIHSKPEAAYEFLDENDVDSIIVAGDVTEFGPESLFVDTLNRFSKYAPVYAIMGNCDPINSDELLDESNVTNIHNRWVKMGNTTLIGYGGSNPTPFDTPNEFSDELIYDSLIKFKDELQSDDFVILVTHAPALDTKCDKIQAGSHVGSMGVRRIIKETQPNLNLCGHVHESIAVDTLDNTILVNPGNEFDNHAAIINIEDNEVKVELINLKGE